MKKRVKKFGRGGDILTGLGAGLLGYAAYKKLTEGKGGDKDDDYARRVKEYGLKGKFPEEKSEEKAKPETKAREEDSPAKQRALAASKGRPEMGDATNDDIIAKRATPPAARTTTPTVKKSLVAPAPAAKPTVSKATPNTSKPNAERPSKPYPEKEAEANKVKNIPGVTVMQPSDKEIKEIKAKQARAAQAKKGQGLTPYAPSGREEIMRKNRFHKEAELGRGIKKGGMVKKYAAGGTTTSKPEPKKAPMPDFAREAKENRERDQRVKKEREAYDKYDKTRLKDQGSFKNGGMTASKRGDGIATRGKTRCKVY
jgi:hypothetical protein